MSAHVLLNLLNKMRIGDKMRRYFLATSYIFNNTGARMLDSIYHMTLKLIKRIIENVEVFVICYATV